MKATLATLACLLTVGFLSAAEVTGNNTAVVIRKNVVESNTGFQFLCVPVDGLDIANGTQKTVKLSTLLPASTLTAGTKITFVGGDLNGTTVQVNATNNGNVWGDGTDASNPSLEGGQIYWLSYQAPVVSNSARRGGGVTTYAQTTGNDTVIFCGQNRERADVTLGDEEKGVIAMANDSSVPLALTDVVTNPTNLDTILVIQAGSSDYKQYNYYGGTWYGPNGSGTANVKIAPGEAFYYFKRK